MVKLKKIAGLFNWPATMEGGFDDYLLISVLIKYYILRASKLILTITHYP